MCPDKGCALSMASERSVEEPACEPGELLDSSAVLFSAGHN